MAESFFGKTDTGKQRNNNEDTFIVETTGNGSIIAGCVIDGVGGYDGGEIAAEIARKTISENLNRIPGDVIGVMKYAFETANTRIIEEKRTNDKHAQMACVATMAVADIAQNKFYYAHVGDTRLYLLRDESLIKVTRDHSVVGFLEDSGRLSEEEAMQHPKRNEINKALGFDSTIKDKNDFIETGESPFLPGDMILLCSDGLTDMISNAEISKILRFKSPLKIKAKLLIDAANSAGGKDNITVVLIHNNKSKQQHEVTKPVVVNNIPPVEQTERKEEVKEIQPVQQKKIVKNRGLVIFLTILSIALFCALIWVLLKDSAVKDTVPPVKPGTNVIIQQRSAEETQLVNLIRDSSNVTITDSNHVITLTDSLVIRRDSLVLHGNGVTIISDSAYRGVALSIPSTSKYILVDSVTFRNFDIGILTRSSAVRLKNVKFENCRVPLQYSIIFAEATLVTGKIKDSVFNYSNPIPTQK